MLVFGNQIIYLNNFKMNTVMLWHNTWTQLILIIFVLKKRTMVCHIHWLIGGIFSIFQLYLWGEFGDKNRWWLNNTGTHILYMYGIRKDNQSYVIHIVLIYIQNQYSWTQFYGGKYGVMKKKISQGLVCHHWKLLSQVWKMNHL